MAGKVFIFLIIWYNQFIEIIVMGVCMAKIELKYDYIRVREEKGFSYGGDQNWFQDGILKGYGCGLVAIGDIILYMAKGHKPVIKNVYDKMNSKVLLEKEEYLGFLRRLSRGLFLVPPKGMIGPAIALGFNIYAICHKSSARAFWGCWCKDIHTEITRMIKENIPVLFSVGANFPFIWKKEGVHLYRKVMVNGKEVMSGCGTVFRHFMVITGLVENDEYGEMIKLSSWGKEYYLSWEEFENYLKKKSNKFFTNILSIKK